jgi:tRNA (uracil-5-)-methyltransferase
MRLDIEALLKARGLISSEAEGEEQEAAAADDAVELPTLGSEIEVEVLDLSSTGDGLAMRPSVSPPDPQVYVVPFTVPGDTAMVRVYRHLRAERRSLADFLSVVRPSPQRDDARVRCPYFARCGGCQFQMLDYPEQLRLKRRVLDKAYRNFSNLAPELVPAIGDTIGSPLQYGYRTKLTPHFDGPPGSNARGKRRQAPAFQTCPDIGFMLKGQRRVVDIEECPIGTDVVNVGMKGERQRMHKEFAEYKRGATILLRESTQRYAKGDKVPMDENLPAYSVKSETPDGAIEVKTCETDHKATTTEFIDSYTFTNPAGSFFQNNNSILPTFTSYIRKHILPPSSSGSPIKYLIDAYSGSGLFTITLSSVFQHSTGIDIAADSIASARQNAALNGLSDDFLAQLRRFGPRRVVYVSCNVHTQARDVGVLVRGEGEGKRYEIESLRGFDFFPQTGHVEGVAILNRV